jgi:hypothetical protein
MRASIQALLLVAFLSAPLTGRTAVRMSDFANGARLTAPDKSGLVGVVLTETVYRRITRADAGDIAIFRMDGRAVPHFLERAPADADRAMPRNLPIFPLYTQTVGTDSPEMRYRTNADGAILNLSGSPADEEGRAVTGYLIDHSHFTQGLAKLTLVWRRKRPKVLIQARLDASRDLTHWQPLVPAVILWDLRYEDLRLENRTLFLPAGKQQGRYFKLSWISGADAVVLEAVKGMPFPRNPLPRLQWTRAVYRSDQQASGSMQFDSGGWFPVNDADVQFSPGGSLLFGTLQSRGAERGVWRIHHRGAFYQLAMEDQILRSPPVAVPETTDRYWRLDIDRGRSRLGNNVPYLMLGWRPQRLFFMAQRGGAYLLAYGSRTAVAPAPPAELAKTLAAAGERITTLDIGPGVNLGGAARAETPPRRSSGRMVSVSSLLLGCVLLLAFFAWWMVRRLLKIDTRSRF